MHLPSQSQVQSDEQLGQIQGTLGSLGGPLLNRGNPLLLGFQQLAEGRCRAHCGVHKGWHVQGFWNMACYKQSQPACLHHAAFSSVFSEDFVAVISFLA